MSLAVWFFPTREKLRNMGSEGVPEMVLRRLPREGGGSNSRFLWAFNVQ